MVDKVDAVCVLWPGFLKGKRVIKTLPCVVDDLLTESSPW